MNLKILNSKEKKRLAQKLHKKYGVDKQLFKGFELLGSEGDVWAVSRECLIVNLEGLKIDSIGLQVLRNRVPTVNGLQLFFKSAKKTELDGETAKRFIKGKEITEDGEIMSYRGFPLDLAVKAEDKVKRQG